MCPNFRRRLDEVANARGSAKTPPPETGTERADGGAAAGLAAHLGSAGRDAGLSGAAGRTWPRGGGWSARGQVFAWRGCWKRRGTCSASSGGREAARLGKMRRTERGSFLPGQFLCPAHPRGLS